MEYNSHRRELKNKAREMERDIYIKEILKPMGYRKEQEEIKNRKGELDRGRHRK